MANLTDAVILDDLERYAATCLDKTAFDYFSTGANDDVTLQENRQAFKRYTYLTAQGTRIIRYWIAYSHPKLTLTLTQNCLSNLPKLNLRYLANRTGY